MSRNAFLTWSEVRKKWQVFGLFGYCGGCVLLGVLRWNSMKIDRDVPHPQTRRSELWKSRQLCLVFEISTRPERRASEASEARRVSNDFWRFLTIFDDFWRFLTIFDDFWRFLTHTPRVQHFPTIERFLATSKIAKRSCEERQTTPRILQGR